MRRRTRVVFIIVVLLVAGVFLYRRLRPPPPAVVEAPPPPPAAETRGPPLQADAAGRYIPGYRFTVGRFRFAGFSLRPEALVYFARTSGGRVQPGGCLEAQITPSAVRLRCDYFEVGTVTIDGRFLTRTATDRLDTPVVSAALTVRNARGEILYQARDSFTWEPDQ